MAEVKTCIDVYCSCGEKLTVTKVQYNWNGVELHTLPCPCRVEIKGLKEENQRFKEENQQLLDQRNKLYNFYLQAMAGIEDLWRRLDYERKS